VNLYISNEIGNFYSQNHKREWDKRFRIKTEQTTQSWNICVANEHGYVPFVVITIQSFPHSWLIIGLVTKVTRQMLQVEKDLLTLPEHMSSPIRLCYNSSRIDESGITISPRNICINAKKLKRSSDLKRSILLLVLLPDTKAESRRWM
jgi:hypothetical protein